MVASPGNRKQSHAWPRHICDPRCLLHRSCRTMAVRLAACWKSAHAHCPDAQHLDLCCLMPLSARAHAPHSSPPWPVDTLPVRITRPAGLPGGCLTTAATMSPCSCAQRRSSRLPSLHQPQQATAPAGSAPAEANGARKAIDSDSDSDSDVPIGLKKPKREGGAAAVAQKKKAPAKASFFGAENLGAADACQQAREVRGAEGQGQVRQEEALCQRAPRPR